MPLRPLAICRARRRCTSRSVTTARPGVIHVVVILISGLVFGAAETQAQWPINVWVEGGGGVVLADSYSPDFGVRGSGHLFVGNFGLTGRIVHATPRQDGLGARGGLRDPTDEITEVAVSLERVLFSNAGAIFYVGGGVTRRSGERWVGLDGSHETLTRQDIDFDGWTAGVGFRGKLGRFAGVGGHTAFSAGDDDHGHLIMLSLSVLLGKIGR